MIVRIADKMGRAHPQSLVPFGKKFGGIRADMGPDPRRAVRRSRPPRHLAHLELHGAAPQPPSTPSPSSTKSSASSPGYDKLLRLQLLSGNAQHIESASNARPARQGQEPIASRKDLVLPSGDTLFTSGTLGHYSPMLLDLQENESRRSVHPNSKSPPTEI